MNIFEKEKSNNRIIINVIINISVLIIILSASLLVYNQIQVNKDLEISNIKLRKSLEEQKIKSKLTNIISAYTDAINKGDVEKIVPFYANKVNRFFLNTDVGIYDVKKEIIQYTKRNKGAKIIFDTNTVTFNIQNLPYIATIMKEYYTKDGEKKQIITEMRFDKEFKIVFIRDFYTK